MIVAKHFLVDLWASVTSHVLVAELMPGLSRWAATGCIILLSVPIYFLVSKRKRQKRRTGKQPRPFLISRGSNGDFRFWVKGRISDRID